METNKVSLKQLMEIKEAVKYLEDLIKSINDGKIVVQQGDDYVDLQTPKTINVKVEAKSKKDKSKFSIELSWRNAPDSEESVTITSKKPAAPKSAPPAGKTEAQKEPTKSAPQMPAAKAPAPATTPPAAAAKKEIVAQKDTPAAKKPAASSAQKK
ncbi:MAG: amphi-Trp domain-containing protein [Proteobacteria bacterium]|nr:amphi-Trp domain-containing protein [Pseudomonadota bacterium]MBU1736834.1 amphi-Trp domain-containing protein [Pseudomonadota bacterium]